MRFDGLCVSNRIFYYLGYVYRIGGQGSSLVEVGEEQEIVHLDAHPCRLVLDPLECLLDFLWALGEVVTIA